MRRLGILNRAKLLNILSALGLLAALVYAVSMFIYPCIRARGSWSAVQDVWDRWQPLNVGMLAFISSVIAFNIARFNANDQRQRNFRASKAFLPAALSELVSYFHASAEVLVSAWESNGAHNSRLQTPILPQEYKSIFKDCIAHAEPNVGDYLARILAWLQVHDARIRDFVRQQNDVGYISPDRHNLITYFYRLGQLQVLVSKLFDFARNTDAFDNTPLTWEDFRNAYGNLDIWIDTVHIDDTFNLKAFTERRLAMDSGLDT